MPVRVTYVDHTAQLSGGELALFNLLSAIDRTLIEPKVITLSDGPLVQRLRAAGVEVHVLALSSSVLDVRKDSIGVRTFAQWRTQLSSARHVLLLRRLIAAIGTDVVHTNSLKSCILGGCAGRLAGKWVVWHVRDRIDRDYLPPLAVWLVRTLARVVPHHLIANSRATLDTLRLADRSPSKVSVVYSGTVLPTSGSHEGARRLASTRSAHDVAQDAPGATGVPGENRVPVVASIGRIAQWKGQDVLLRAAAIVRDRGIVNARYRFIGAPLFGEQEYERFLFDLARELKLEEIVEFAGFVSNAASELSSIDLLVHTSRTPEPFGQVVVEGMAAARPVIATEAGGVLEIVRNGVTGLLVPPDDPVRLADAIECVLTDPALADRLGRAGRREVQHRFTVEHAARDVESLYAALTGRALARSTVVGSSPSDRSLA